jgi:beta-glucosidase
VACDHYNRWREDVALMKELDQTSYRFSIAWPRIQPTGQGRANQKGLDFYSRLVDELRRQGIRPFPTLYHWDLPQALEDAGGWPNRETADRFGEYCAIVAKALGDRVDDWMVFNEPGVFVLLGYGIGGTPPGRAIFRDAARFPRRQLAQGDGVRAIRAAAPKARVGGLDMSSMEPATGSEADRDAALRWQLFSNAWYVYPALRGKYPEAFPQGVPLAAMGVLDQDFARMKTRFDFLGINHYNRMIVSAATPGMPGSIPGLPRGGKEDRPRPEIGPRAFATS